MTGKRGRPRKTIPVHPNIVLTRTLKTALATAVYLQKTMRNRTTAHLYEASLRVLTRANKRYRKAKQRGTTTLTPIIEAEKNIRKNGLQMLFERGAAYGNTETRRVKSSDKSVGFLNQRFNVGGKVLRDVAMTTFPFPDRQPLHGLHEVYGYPATSLCHEVVPIHNIPELDFIDVCRQHIQILNTWCYIYDVPLNDTARYTNLFLLRARPYLERLYSENRYGKHGFRQGTVRILRELKDDIARYYTVRTGDAPTVTAGLEHEEPTFDPSFFRDQVREARERGIDTIALYELERILEGGSIISTVIDEGTGKEEPAPCLTEQDVRYFWRRLFELSGQRGTQVHQQITGLFPSHWSVERASRFGDELGGEDGYLVCSEIPIDTALGRGRIDLILFRRVVTEDGLNVFWLPVFVLDIKTRMGFMWDLGYQTKDSWSRREHGLPLRKIPEFIISESTLDEKEWTQIVGGTPSENTLTQVNAYADAVAKVYKTTTGAESSPTILRGTLLVDAGDDIRLIRSLVRSLIIGVFESTMESERRIPRTCYTVTLDQVTPSLAIILHEQENVEETRMVSVPAPFVPVQDPLEAQTDDTRGFILYLAAESATSGGASAAWIAKYHHGFQFIKERRERTGKSKTLWIDLADEFLEPSFRESRLGLFPRSRRLVDVIRAHDESVRNIFDSIELNGMFEEIQKFLFKEQNEVSILFDTVPDLIVVSGWDRILGSTPSPYDERLRELKVRLVNQLVKQSEASVLWFDVPLPSEQNSSVYLTRTLIPFYNNSPFYGQVSKILWNVPVAPESEVLPDDWILPYTATAPSYDDIRVVIMQEKRGFTAELVNVPPLAGWSSKFRGDFTEANLETLLKKSVPEADVRERMKVLAFDLIPWLPELLTKIDLGDGDERSVYKLLLEMKDRYHQTPGQIGIKSKVLVESGKEPSLLERIKFRPLDGKSGRSSVQMAANTINSQRLYRSQYSLKTKKRVSQYSPELIKSKPDERLVFGRIFTKVTPEEQDELLVIQDPKISTGLLVGHFSECCKRDQSGFLWSERDNDRLQSIIEEIDSLDFSEILIRIIDNKQELWQWDYDTEKWTPQSVIEIFSKKVGQIGSIVGIREDQLVTKETIVSQRMLPKSFIDDVKQAVFFQLVHLKEMKKDVKVSLERDDIGCRILLQNIIDDELIHLVGVQSVPDLITILRLPFSENSTLRADDGSLLTWNPFMDIEYGDFDLVRPYVETNAPREVGKQLPQIVEELFETEEEQVLYLVLGHDREKCPIVLNTDILHGNCWTVKSANSGISLPQFVTSMSGKEIYGQLATGKISIGKQVYDIQLILEYKSNEREFYVYHEDDWIRRLLHEKDMHLKKLVPGTYFRDDERWIIDFVIQDNTVEWIGVSSISGIYWKNKVFHFTMNPGLSLDEVKNEFFRSITREIPTDSILNLNEIDQQIMMILSNRGYSESGPPCQLLLTRNGREIMITLYEGEELMTRIIHKTTFVIEKNESREAILNGFYHQLEEGELSKYNIINIERFFEELESMLDKMNLRNDY
ncbi:hypothetical protein EU527_11555 [Candidatus Thorarchaeota archaeon]|nr:MAG: hypothetical protein EU527_11555 [Candidatus Thorarchaeota archaeon]